MPGLIDLHVHTTQGNDLQSNAPGFTSVEGEITVSSETDRALIAAERLRYYIESGITSIRDVAAHGLIPFRLKEWVFRNRLVGPRVFPVGQLITGTGGHGAERKYFSSPFYAMIRIADGPDEWRKAVREQFNKGADAIKLASHFSREEIAAAVDEAHALGFKVCVDAETFYVQ